MASDSSNPELLLAEKVVNETGYSLFLTGRAGTGKTTFLKNLRASSRKKIVVAAPTGIAAINAEGMTLHSLFQLEFSPYIPGHTPSKSKSFRFHKHKIKLIRGMDILVIDEISMVRADILDAVDAVLRRFRDRTRPFGGVQLLLIGDLQQLPPVVVDAEREILAGYYDTPYFFSSKALSQIRFVTIELKKVYRQQDQLFLDILNAIRERTLTRRHLEILNSRVNPGFNPPEEENYIRLTTHNRKADEINMAKLEALQTESRRYKANVSGIFPESSFPAPRSLELKIGEQVMFVKNDTGMDRRFYNGMIGRVVALDDESVSVLPSGSDNPVTVEPVEWENRRFQVNEESKEIEEVVDGVFKQLPLRAAWAITIHKSQGLTFDKAIIDASLAFTHGQTYVALSRCRTLEGIVLERPITASSIITDYTVERFLDSEKSTPVTTEGVERMSRDYTLELIQELFSFDSIMDKYEGVVRILKEHYSSSFPALVSRAALLEETGRKDFINVAATFRNQCARLMPEEGIEPGTHLSERIKAASAYFLPKIDEVISLMNDIPLKHDSSKVSRLMNEKGESLLEDLKLKDTLIKKYGSEEFSPKDYLRTKADALLGPSAGNRQKGNFSSLPKAVASRPEDKDPVSEDILHPLLFADLTKWRSKKAALLEKDEYQILPAKYMLRIANEMPSTVDDLLCISGLGKKKVERFGEDILDIVRHYRENDL